MKSLTWLMETMLADLSIVCSTPTARDVLTMRRRIEYEGVSFLTITLPTFHDGFLQAIARGRIGSDDFVGFRFVGGRGASRGLPAFLQGFLSQVFDGTTGVLLHVPSTDAISAVRQICLAAKKLRLECSPRRVTRALDRYVEADAELVRALPGRKDPVYRRFVDTSRVLWGSVLGREADRLNPLTWTPKHGPGATAERILGNQKYVQRKWHERLEHFFPSATYLSPNEGFDWWQARKGSYQHYQPHLNGDENADCDPCEVCGDPRPQAHAASSRRGFAARSLGSLSGQQRLAAPVGSLRSPLRELRRDSSPASVQRRGVLLGFLQPRVCCCSRATVLGEVFQPLRGPRDEQPTRVVCVPKTLKTPRIIAIEPVCMQYAQQAVAQELVPVLESSPDLDGAIRFTDQTKNQEMAMRGSRGEGFATLDLSEASDRVHCRLVSDMLNVFPSFRGAVMACRSSRAELPDGRSISLKKFASMGSALCFPMEAMVFYTIIASSLLGSRNLRVSVSNIKRVMKGILVYGDDLIIPVDKVEVAVRALHAFGMKVNASKSFGTGKFRESCGKDYFDGRCVTPTYLRHLIPRSKRDAQEIVTNISTANQFYLAGLWKTARYLREAIESVVGSLPHVLPSSPGMGWVSINGTYSIERWNVPLQRPEARTLLPVTLTRRDSIDDIPALLKVFLTRRDKPSEDEEHLERSVRRGIANTKRHWTTPF